MAIDFAPVPAFFIAVLVICIAPGPDMMYMVGAGLGGGRPAATRAAFGITLGVTVYVVATAFGLGLAASAYPQVLAAIQLIGAAYLAWVAYTTFRDSGNGPSMLDDGGARKWFRQGFFVNLTNPKITLFFIAFLPQFAGKSNNLVLQFIVLGLLLQTVGLIIDLIIGWAAGAVRSRVLSRPSMVRVINVVSGLVFAGLAVFAAVDGIATIV